MICRECENKIGAYPCACGYRPKELHGQIYLIQHCSTLGCFTAIRVKAGHQDATPLCKWCTTGESHAMNGHPDVDIHLRYKSTA